MHTYTCMYQYGFLSIQTCVQMLCNDGYLCPFTYCIFNLSTYIHLLMLFIAHCPQGCYNGRCVAPNKCDCTVGWTSLNCSKGTYIYIP